MHRLAHLSDEERRRIVDDFLDEVFDGLDIDPASPRGCAPARPELPDDPTPEQVDAWIELAELVRDEDFRAAHPRRCPSATRPTARRAATQPGEPAALAARGRARRRARGRRARGGHRPRLGRGGADRRRARAPRSPRPRVRRGRPARARRAALADRLATGTDARAERYWQLLAVINGRPPVPTTVPAWEWLIAALRARASLRGLRRRERSRTSQRAPAAARRPARPGRRGAPGAFERELELRDAGGERVDRVVLDGGHGVLLTADSGRARGKYPSAGRAASAVGAPALCANAHDLRRARRGARPAPRARTRSRGGRADRRGGPAPSR